MSDEHSGFIMDIKNPTREGEDVACLVITPMLREAKLTSERKSNGTWGDPSVFKLPPNCLSDLEHHLNWSRK